MLVGKYRACHANDYWVRLTDEEYREALELGTETFRSSQRRGFKDHWAYHRSGQDGLYAQQLGALGERAVAKALGVEWTPKMDTFRNPDLGYNIEVRAHGRHWYGLRIRSTDDDSRRVVGIVIEKGKEREPYRIFGWINAKHGKRPEYQIDPRSQGLPMYAVPQDRLHGLDKLAKLCGVEKQLSRLAHTQEKVGAAPTAAPKFDNDHKCQCGRYGGFGKDDFMTGRTTWFCREHWKG